MFIIYIISLLISSELVFAKNFAYPSLYIKSIQTKKIQEKQHDELFLQLIEKPNKKVTNLYRIPPFPLYWHNLELPSISNYPIWTGLIQNNQIVLLKIDLMEQDFPPWDNNDILGSLVLTLHNINGVIQNTWDIQSNNKITHKAIINQTEHIQKIKFLKNDSYYIVEFGLTEKKLLYKPTFKTKNNRAIINPYHGILYNSSFSIN